MEVQQTEQGDQVAEMQTAGGRIHATVDGCGASIDVIYQIRANKHVSVRLRLDEQREGGRG